MPRGKYPRNVYWKQVSAQLRDLQDRISRYQGRFRAAGRADIAEDLERCIQLLMNAADAAMTLGVRGTH
jgi:hypothetical protein